MITIPDLQYKVQNVDIGSDYAKGITSAGQSIAGAIKNVMGGDINPQTGEVNQGILQQNQTATDFIHQMGQSGAITPEMADSINQGSLGAKQKWIGLLSTTYAYRAQAAAEQAKAIAVAKGTAAATQPYTIAQIQETGAQAQKTAQAAREATGGRIIQIQPPAPANPANPALPIPNNPLKKSLQQNQQNGGFNWSAGT
jgi:hypothetical protein